MRIHKPNRLYDGGLIILLIIAALAAGGGFLAYKGGGIAGVLGARVTQSHIDAAKQAYTGGFLIPSVAYRCLYDNTPAGCPTDKATGRKFASNPCPPGVHASFQNICAERAVVVRLQETDKVVQAAFGKIEQDFVACRDEMVACDTLGTSYRTLMTTIDAAKALMAQYAIGG